ncbi:hypothetical protein PFICI_02431 [Pestalotiopsis fici W106-1]|uniref:cutinase n=1 Tax=Pestalotiopsis fici (strain W106-1 / CGMCC3.15140) TaxID=1229662 RepID=W3XGR1_PESFW|nr:uncharacterized protein PFICI_02431 [Pestalotiopsis fici W106-1]ETS84406.1 hypothetical protein PFICI_02431 [Pestalotiopsis fici W106-1]
MKTTQALSTLFLAGLSAAVPVWPDYSLTGLSSLLPTGSSLTGSADAAASSSSATAASGCTAYTVLFARGTTETGTLGTVVGPGLQKAVQSSLGADQVTMKGTSYPADMAGITSEATGSGPGSKAMTADATSVLSSCPDTKIILTGYSQGGMVVHNAAKQIKAAGKSVIGAVTFGDPYVGQLPTGVDAAHFDSFCASGDSVCGAGSYGCAASGGCKSSSTSGHLGYGSDVNAAAAFIKSIAV